MMKDKKKKPKKKKHAPLFVSKYNIDISSAFKVEKIPLTIKLSGLRSEYSTFEMSVPMNYSFQKVAELINKKNNNSCRNIKLYIGDESNCLDNVMNMSFIDLGVTKPEPTVLFYKFEPVENPILLAGFYI